MYSPASVGIGPRICSVDVTVVVVTCSLIRKRPDSPVTCGV